MSKAGRSKRKPSRRKRNVRIWQLLLAIIVVGGLASAWILVSREASPDKAAASDGSDPVQPESRVPGLENRMVLPAMPHEPRPVTLSPVAFEDPEVKSAYQAAKDVPEVLEHLACYCGCFGNAGHRNNLDCFKDSHGTTCSLCRAIALEGQRQSKLGTPIQQIKRIVDERWAPRIR